MRHPLRVLFAAALAASPAGAQEAPLLDARVRDLLHEELSGEIAKEHVIAITRHHRIQGSRGYRAAAQVVLEALRKAGFGEEDAWIESFPSDGRVRYQTWQSPSGWDIESAELRMVEPEDELIVRYPEIAMSVITYSNPGDVRAELVWVGSGTKESDYEGKDVAGKFVLATGYGGAVHRLAVLKHGAAAVVCYLDDARALEYPDMLQYTGMWPRTEELERVTFGFNLTHRQGERLRKLLEAGRKVVLHGRVSGIGLEPFFMDVVVARIAGSEAPEEEIVFTAHLDHPKESANDNASGSGAAIDLARGLRALIASERLPRPKRTLRFLWVPEFYGTMAYIDAHPELAGPPLGGKVLANLNLDMVGENLELLHVRCELTRTPDSLPSVLNDVVENMARMVDGMEIRTPRGSLSVFNWRMTPFAGGSDHMAFIERKVPGVMFWHDPDYTHHTSEDTPDKVDPVELERCEILAGGTAWFLANLGEGEAVDLAGLAAAKAAGRFGESARRARRTVDAAPNEALPLAWAEAQNLLDFAASREKESVASVLHFRAGERVAAVAQRGQEWIEGLRAAEAGALREIVGARLGDVPAMPPAEGAADDRVPVRATRGMVSDDSPPAGLSGEARFEVVNFVDGTRTVGAIRNALAAEFGPIETAAVARYLEHLVEAGILRWK